jgi:competence protein ComEA
MVEAGAERSRDEHEFWDAQFRDPPHARAEPRGPSRRELRRPVADDPMLGRVADRLREWRTDARFGVVVLVAIALLAGVAWYRIGISGSGGKADAAPAAVSTTAPATTLPGAASGAVATAATATAKGQPTSLAVHVAGAVAHPGVVELRAGARVIDAVEAVGGASADGDLDRLNLAAKVVDGQRVYVAKVGQSDPGLGAGDGGTVDPGGSSAGATAGGKVNVNTATQAQLEELPGIGPTFAQSIIAERQRRGGFRSVNDLRSVRGIGDKRFADLAPLVAV